MGVSYHPTTTTRGLINCFDTVGNNPIIGTTFVDRSLSRNNGTLSGGNQVINSGIPFIRFSGVDGNLQLNSNPSLGNALTIEMVARFHISTTGTPLWLVGRELSYRMIYSTGSINWICATSNNSWYSSGTAISYNINLSGSLAHIVGVYDGIKNSLFLNGILVSSGSQINGTVLNNGNYNIGRSDAQPSVGYGCFDLYLHKAYNTALTPSEVSRNFNAIKGRFRL